MPPLASCRTRRRGLAAGRRLLAPFGREQAAGQFVDAYADMHATNAVPKWPRLTGKRAPATHNALAIETEPPQVSSLPVAQIQWHRTGEPRDAGLHGGNRSVL
jgi:hypothetical protein